MPRNPSTGVYSKPAGTTPSVGQVIDPVPWNALTTDLGNEITNSLPRDGSAPMVAPIKAASGTVSAPGVGFASNPQTGLYLKGGGLLGFAQNGVDASFDPALVYTERTDNYTGLASDKGACIRFTAAGKTLTFDDSADLGKDWHITVLADGVSVNVAPSGSDTINGAATFTVPDGYAIKFVCSGTAFYCEELNARFDFFLDCIPAWVNNTTISFSAGVGFFGGKQHLLPAYTKLLNAAFAAGNNAGMLDTGAVQASKTYFLLAIRNTTTAVCDYLCSLSPTAPTVPAGWELLPGSRVGIILTNGSSQIRTFAQSGNSVTMTATQAFATTASSSFALFTLPNCPVGLSVDAFLDLEGSGQQNSDSISYWAAAHDSDAIVVRNRVWGPSGVNSNGTMASTGRVRTNTAAQVYRSVAVAGTTTVLGYMRGWYDWQCKRLWG
ncbi:hypothetical protein M2311_005287 [Rhizobium leguminosarum]|uniref:hypothetical protein n=1 Tax=Rhizobium leguminosarum TaxID=384 RepID=UPI002475FFF4|nr:hypothetical protein [Rhizobium leguminosarum]MDH6275187.1 hypothetical protein [Rhizobium leguminosarum]